MKKLIPISELQLGDVVSLFPDDVFSGCVVRQIKDGYAHLFRPYATTADFSYTGGVIPYIGVEEFTLDMSDKREITLFERKKLK